MFQAFITSPAPLGIAALLYVMQSYGYASKGDYGMALAIGAYAVSNVGFIISYLTFGPK